MKQHRLKGTVLLVVILVGGWVAQSGSGATAYASGLANIATAPAAAPAAAPAVANIPTAFSYQGVLRLANGSLATGSYNITLNIYNVVTGGTPIHGEAFANVPVRNGNFSVVVGDATPINPAVFDNANLYIGITVAPDPEMLPRQRLFPVPWAMQAGSANTAASATTATTLVPNAVVSGIKINKGAANEAALQVVSSGPGWGSGIRFENTAANRAYGIYVGLDGVWQFVDDTTHESRFYVQPNGAVRFKGIVTDNDFFAYGNMRTLANLQVDGGIIANGSVVAGGRVVAGQGFNGTCGPDPGAVGLTIYCNRDVAETFATDQRTEPGDLVVFVPEDRANPAVRLAAQPYANAIVGVVSTNPGLVFDEGKTFLAGDNANLITDKKTVVAMVGRVPAKFSLENGPIAVGDPLTSSSKPGVAMKATQAGQIIGYAMQSSDTAHDGKLLVWLQLGTYIPQEKLDALNNLAATDGAANSSLAELKAQIAALSAEVAALQAGQ